MGDEKYLVVKDEGQPLIVLSVEEKEMLGLIFKATKDMWDDPLNPVVTSKFWILFFSHTVRELAKRLNWEIPQ